MYVNLTVVFSLRWNRIWLMFFITTSKNYPFNIIKYQYNDFRNIQLTLGQCLQQVLQVCYTFYALYFVISLVSLICNKLNVFYFIPLNLGYYFKLQLPEFIK